MIASERYNFEDWNLGEKVYFYEELDTRNICFGIVSPFVWMYISEQILDHNLFRSRYLKFGKYENLCAEMNKRKVWRESISLSGCTFISKQFLVIMIFLEQFDLNTWILAYRLLTSYT